MSSHTPYILDLQWARAHELMLRARYAAVLTCCAYVWCTFMHGGMLLQEYLRARIDGGLGGKRSWATMGELIDTQGLGRGCFCHGYRPTVRVGAINWGALQRDRVAERP